MRRAGASSVARSQPRSRAEGVAGSRFTCSSERSNAGRERLSCCLRAMYPPMASSSRTTRMMTQSGTATPLQHDVARAQVRADLALDALERVVDRLAVAVELLADRRVGVPVEVQREHARLQLGEHGRQAGDQGAQLLGGDDLVD